MCGRFANNSDEDVYVVNYIGEKHIKKHVEAHIYGNSNTLNLILYNSLKNLCKEVIIEKWQMIRL